VGYLVNKNERFYKEDARAATLAILASCPEFRLINGEINL
jgi:hypothetical protein